MIVIFTIPAEWGDSAKYAYFFITYTLLNAVIYTANNIAYSALTSLITRNGSERVQMGSVRFVFAFGTSLLIQSFTMKAVEICGGGASGWRTAAVIYALIGLVVNTISVFSVKELSENEGTEENIKEKNENYSLVEAVKLVLANKYYLIICAVYILTQLFSSMLSMGIYYMTYILGNADLLGTFSLAINIPMIFGLFLTPYLVRKCRGMYHLNLAGYAIATAARAMVIVGGYLQNIPMMLLFTGIAALGMSPMQGNLNALIAACSDYTYRTKGRRIEGTMYSCSALGLKIGIGVETALSGWLLAAGDYVANAAWDSAHAA